MMLRKCSKVGDEVFIPNLSLIFTLAHSLNFKPQFTFSFLSSKIFKRTYQDIFISTYRDIFRRFLNHSKTENSGKFDNCLMCFQIFVTKILPPMYASSRNLPKVKHSSSLNHIIVWVLSLREKFRP